MKFKTFYSGSLDEDMKPGEWDSIVKKAKSKGMTHHINNMLFQDKDGIRWRYKPSISDFVKIGSKPKNGWGENNPVKL